ncbi:hypothetical protein D9M68_954060 [compost metagenome]
MELRVIVVQNIWHPLQQATFQPDREPRERLFLDPDEVKVSPPDQREQTSRIGLKQRRDDVTGTAVALSENRIR